ncbi:MAG TPA: type II toxin-antitoxin system RelE/ParE family toxin [Steroidobacteraceae bacterium]|nr:type II toxin-antitoxin system RelE/ParE family toxin [Steroidobacteraceae bacterium]
MRRVFKTKTFRRWSRKARISDDVLCAAVEEMMQGLIDADLGGRVFKKRVPVPGRGKRSGARTIVGSNLQDRWFFLFGFEKKDRETIDARELVALQTIAAALLAMDPKLLEKAVAEDELEEICHEEKSPAR